jgi:hypothetical protein
MIRPTYWNDENRARLMALVEGDTLVHSIANTATRLGTTRQAIVEGMKRFSLKPRGGYRFAWTAHRLSLLTRHVSEDGQLTVSPALIARELGCSSDTVVTGLLLLEDRAPRAFDAHALATLKSLIDGHGRLTKDMFMAAVEIGCSMKGLKAALRRYGFRGHARFAWTKKNLTALQRLCRHDGTLPMTIDTAAALIGCSPRSIDNGLRLLRQRRASISLRK